MKMSPQAYAFRRFIEYPGALHSQCDPIECHEQQRGSSLCIHSNYDSKCLDWKQIIPGHLYANTRHERLCNVPNIVLDSNVSLMWPVLWENWTERIQATNHDLGQCWLNSLRAKFCTGNINIYLHFMLLFHIDMTQVLKNPSSSKSRTYIFYIVNINAADVLAT